MPPRKLQISECFQYPVGPFSSFSLPWTRTKTENENSKGVIGNALRPRRKRVAVEPNEKKKI